MPLDLEMDQENAELIHVCVCVCVYIRGRTGPEFSVGETVGRRREQDARARWNRALRSSGHKTTGKAMVLVFLGVGVVAAPKTIA